MKTFSMKIQTLLPEIAYDDFTLFCKQNRVTPCDMARYLCWNARNMFKGFDMGTIIATLNNANTTMIIDQARLMDGDIGESCVKVADEIYKDNE
jgi:hypothetical protein